MDRSTGPNFFSQLNSAPGNRHQSNDFCNQFGNAAAGLTSDTSMGVGLSDCLQAATGSSCTSGTGLPWEFPFQENQSKRNDLKSLQQQQSQYTYLAGMQGLGREKSMETLDPNYGRFSSFNQSSGGPDTLSNFYHTSGISPESSSNDVSSERVLLARRMQSQIAPNESSKSADPSSRSFLAHTMDPREDSASLSGTGFSAIDLTLLQRLEQQQQLQQAGFGQSDSCVMVNVDSSFSRNMEGNNPPISNQLLLKASYDQNQEAPLQLTSLSPLVEDGMAFASPDVSNRPVSERYSTSLTASSLRQSQQEEQDYYTAQGILGPWSAHAAGLMEAMVPKNPSKSTSKSKRPRRKQPKDKPKRPLSAYNVFFKEERARLILANKQENSPTGKRAATSKIGFENLAKTIGGKWQNLTPDQAEYYQEKAAIDMKRYLAEMEKYKSKQQISRVKSGVSLEEEYDDEDAKGGNAEDALFGEQEMPVAKKRRG